MSVLFVCVRVTVVACVCPTCVLFWTGGRVHTTTLLL